MSNLGNEFLITRTVTDKKNKSPGHTIASLLPVKPQYAPVAIKEGMINERKQYYIVSPPEHVYLK